MNFKDASISQLYQIIKNENCKSNIKEAAYLELHNRYMEVMRWKMERNQQKNN